MPTVKQSELEMAMDWLSGKFGEDQAYICRKSGEIYWVPEDPDIVGEELDIPADIEDADKYVPVPDKRDLDLGVSLVLDFMAEHLPDSYDQVRSIFRRKGAYSRYKDLLDRKGKLQAWYDFECEHSARALAQWCKDEGLDLEP